MFIAGMKDMFIAGVCMIDFEKEDSYLPLASTDTVAKIKLKVFQGKKFSFFSILSSHTTFYNNLVKWELVE